MAESSLVLLGIPDEALGTHATDWSTSKVGGTPDCFSTGVAPPACGICGGVLSMVCQVYCPLEGSQYHRTLHVFACTMPACWNQSGSWCVLRSQKLDASTSQQPCHQSSSENLDWGVDATEWDDDGSAMATSDWCPDADDWGDEDQSSCAASESPSPCLPIDSPLGISDRSGLEARLNEPAAEESVVEGLGQMSLDGTGDQEGASPHPQCIAETTPEQPQYMAQLLQLSDTRTMNTSEEQTTNSSSNLQQICDNDISSSTSLTGCTSQPSAPASVVFDSFFVNVLSEPTEDEAHLNHEQKLLKEYTRREGCDLEAMMDSVGGGGKGSERYEKSQTQHGDQVFHKFTKRLARCPQQILRYSWNGQPLYIRPADGSVARPCAACGGKSVFEMQLMPGLVSLLTTSGNTGALEFGVVLVYTCQASCWEDGANFRTEQVNVQADPDQHLYKAQ